MRTPQAFSDESPRSFLTRLSEANGYDSPQVIVDLIRETGEYYVTTGWDYSQVRSVLGPDYVLPPNFGYRVPGKQVREQGQLLGSPIQTRHLGLAKARICVCCVSELGYVPAAWDLKAYLACPIHGCMMLKFCQACGMRIRHVRPGLLTCECGADLRRAPIFPAPVALVAFCEVLHALATRDQSLILQARKLCMPVESLLKLHLDVFARVAVTLAGVVQAIQQYRPCSRPYWELIHAFPAVAETFTHWPAKFQLLCGEWHDNPSNTFRNDGFQERFSWLFIRLHKNLWERSSQTVFMLEAACAYGRRRWGVRPLRIRNELVDQAKLPEPRFGTAKAAGKILGIDGASVARWAAIGIIPATRGGGRLGARYWCIDLDAIRHMNCSRVPVVNRKLAAKELGISARALRALVLQGAIPLRHVLGGKKSGSVTRDDFKKFKDAMLRQCRPADVKVQTMPLVEALRGKSSERQAEIVTGIIDGKVAVYDSGHVDVLSICVPLPSKPISVPKKSVRVLPTDHMNQTQIIERFGLWQYEAEAILRMLGCRSPRCVGDDKSIETRAIQQFFEQYILVRTLAEEVGVHSRRLGAAIQRWRPGAVLVIGAGSRNEPRKACLLPRRHVAIAKKLARELTCGATD